MTKAVETFFEQGSEQWRQNRIGKFNASELSAAMGISPYVSRNDLLRLHSTGREKEYSEFVENVIFPRGHRVEVIVRNMVEKDTDQDFIPKCFKLGNYACSLDGQNVFGTINLEVKQYNAEIFEKVSNGEMPEDHFPQVQQGLWITGAEYCIFAVCSQDETTYAAVSVYPDTDFIAQIPMIWGQFKKDCDSLSLIEHEKLIANVVPISMPTLFVQAHGEITASNIQQYCDAADTSLEAIKSIVWQTDQDFEDANAWAKVFRDQCVSIKEAKKSMLASTMSIGEASDMMDLLHEKFRVAALKLEKDYKENDNKKKGSIISAARLAFIEYHEELQEKIQGVKLLIPHPDFQGAIKNKRNYASIQNAVDTLLANSKIEADKIAKDYHEKLAWYHENKECYVFYDLQTFIAKPFDDFKLVIKSRINDLKAADTLRLEQERERIRMEEESKAQREIEAKLRAEQAEKDRLDRERIDAEYEAGHIPDAATIHLDGDYFAEIKSNKIAQEMTLTSYLVDEFIANQDDDFHENLKELREVVQKYPKNNFLFSDTENDHFADNNNMVKSEDDFYSKAKQYLLPAQRPHRYNTVSEELIFAYDYKETIILVADLMRRFEQHADAI